MSISKKLISNTIYLFLDWFFVTLLSFIYWVVAGKTLLPKQYGIVSTSVNLAVLFSGLSLFGLNTTLSKLLPEYFEKKQMNKAKELIIFSLKTILLSNLLLIFSLLISSSLIAKILEAPTIVIFITAMNLLVISFSSQFAAVFVGMQDMKKIAKTDLIGQVVKITISALLIFLGFNYFGPLIGYFLGMLVVVAMRIPFKFLEGIKKTYLDKKQIFLDFALPAFVSNLAWVIFVNGQYVLLTAIKNPETTGIFTVAMLLTSPILSVPNVLSSALFPIISQLSINHNSKGRQRYLITMVFKYALLFSVPAAIFLIMFSNHVILLFSRSEYLPASTLFPLLALASIIYGAGNIFNQILYSLGKPKIQRNIILLTVLIFFILTIPLTILFSAFGMCLAYLVAVSVFFFLSYKNVNKILRLPLPWDSIKKILFSGILSFTFLYAISSSTPNIFVALVFCLLAGLLYLELLFLMKFYTKQDVLFLEIIVEKTPILKKQLKKIVEFFYHSLR